MEPELINRAKINRSTMRQGYALTQRKGILFLLIFPVVFFFLVTLIDWIRYQFVFIDPTSLAIYAGSLALIAILALTQPLRSARSAILQLEERYSSRENTFTYHFFAEEITAEDAHNTSPLRIRYDVLKKVMVGKNVIVLFTRAKQFFVLDRAGFGPGTEADFWRLMEEKAPKALPRSIRKRQKGA